MIKKYAFEIDGQRDFYESYLKMVDNSLSAEAVLSDNTDGVLNGNLLEFKLNINDLEVAKIHTIYSKEYYDKRVLPGDVKTTVLIGLDGLEKTSGKLRNTPYISDSIIGYLVANTSGFDNPDLNSSLLVGGRYDGNGFYLRRDNYLEKLPMYAASRYITHNRGWSERARIMKSADGSNRYNTALKDGTLSQYLFKVLIFTVFESHNHIRSFWGSDKHFYRNELCLDVTNGETVASLALKNYAPNKKEREMLSLWKLIIELAKTTKNYNKELTYGIYQISVELDTFVHDDETDRNVYDYPELHGHLQTMKKFIKEYYNSEIVPTLFEYEFLK